VDGLSFESWEEIDAVALNGTETPPGDTDGDLVIGIVDFLALLAAWGPNPGHPADFNDDDFVGVQDLEILLSNWGGCS
jgi:hypothetical protein